MTRRASSDAEDAKTPLTSSRVKGWADAHDADSLRAVIRHRDELLSAVRADPSQTEHALALARLIDLEGDSGGLGPILQSAYSAASDPASRASLRLALAQLDFEAGRIEACVSHLDAAIEMAREAGRVETTIKARLCQVRIAQVTDEAPRADALLDAVELELGQLGSPLPWLRCAALMLRAGSLLGAGKKLAARASLEAGLEQALAYRGATDASIAAGMLGNVEHDLGDLEAAAAWFAQATRHARASGSVSVEAIFTGYRAWALHELGRVEPSVAAYRKAIQLAEAAAVWRFHAQFRALRAVVGVTSGNAVRREMDLAAALGDLAATGDAERSSAFSVLRAVIEASRARHEGPAAAAVRLVRATRILERFSATSDDGRIALRLASAAVDRVLAAVEPDAELVLTPDARTLCVAGHVASVRQIAPRRILRALVEGWVEGRALPDAELIEFAWPDERMLPKSATHRLQVAISTLRKAGLGSRIERVGGYRLRLTSLALVRDVAGEPSQLS